MAEEKRDDTRMNCVWHRITIDVPELTRGEKLRDFISQIGQIEAIGTAVIVAGVEGGGDPELGITQLGCVLMSIEELVKRLCFTSQIDWANLHFIAAPDKELEREVCGGLSIGEAISKSSVSIRVIDNSSLDVFTTDRNLAASLLKQYPRSHVESSSLSEMVFPQ